MLSALHNLMVAGGHPMTWDEYKGQDMAKNMLRRAARSAQRRGARMDHVLIESPTPGIGKTSLAFLVGAELGTFVATMSGTITEQEMIMSLAMLEDRDVVVIDEAHRMFANRAKAEFMLHLLQHGSILSASGAVEELPKVTFILATTEKAALPPAVLDRMTYVPELVEYDTTTGSEIAAHISARIFDEVDLPRPNERTCTEIAVAASCRPRQMTRLLSSLRDLVLDEDPASFGADGEEGSYDLAQALADCQLTPDGLTKEALRYLQVLAESRRPIGKGQIGEMTGIVGQQVAEVESLLVKANLVEFTKSGRQLTVAGIRRAAKAGLTSSLRAA